MISAAPPLTAERRLSRRATLWFWFRATCFGVRRYLMDQVEPVRRLPLSGQMKPAWPACGRSQSLLYSSRATAEFTLQAGKAQNLRRATRTMSSILIEADTTFSFWAQVGRPTRRRGFVHGRELREGCIIPSIGGGLCQLSNSLYDAALQAGLCIVERHAHTQRVPGSMAEAGRDATVFWNYIDLRLRAPFPWMLQVSMTDGELIVEIFSERAATATAHISSTSPADHGAESCESCGMVLCHRHDEMQKLTTECRTAWLVDAWWPEHDAWLQAQRKAGDWLLLPMRGKRYPWSIKDWARVRTFPRFVLERSWKSRRLAGQGAARQQTLLALDERLAALYEKALPFDALHLVISQSILPFLHRSGALSGRSYDVLLQRWPLAELEQRLDLAAQSHPQSPTLADFRAPAWLIEAETQALAAAARWITPHRALADIAGERAVLLEWKLSAPSAATIPAAQATDSPQIIFPASTLGRKGAYEVREAARTLGLRIVLGGAILETADFWQGIETISAGADWHAYPGPIVLPAWIENQPRRLLQALGEGRQIIASTACGLEAQPGLTTVPTGSVEALTEAIRSVLTLNSLPHSSRIPPTADHVLRYNS